VLFLSDRNGSRPFAAQQLAWLQIKRGALVHWRAACNRACASRRSARASGSGAVSSSTLAHWRAHLRSVALLSPVSLAVGPLRRSPNRFMRVGKTMLSLLMNRL
jgi:hypothetical protein